MPTLGPPREHQPVHLASLPRSLLPPWPAGSDGLGWLAQREPLLELPGRHGATVDQLLALAQRCAQGIRVVLELPPGTDLRPHAATLETIGRCQWPLKVVIDAQDLPWPLDAHGLSRWWVACPGRERDGVLAWALAGEEPVLVALADQQAAAEACEPGRAHELAPGTTGTLVCLAADADLARQRAQGRRVLQITSLIPLPLPQLLATPRPVSVLGEDLARHLAQLSTLDPRLHWTLEPAG